jgi:hypothetical protein
VVCGFTKRIIEKYGEDIIFERGLFSLPILFYFIFSICLFEVKNLKINANNTEKLSVNELTMKFNVGSEWVGTIINHPITDGIYKLYVYFPVILF